MTTPPRRRSIGCLTVAWLVLFTGVAASADTYYVATDGDDGGPGTLAQPWRTIQKAADTMVAGDTVLIRGGTYLETVSPLNTGTVDDVITYQGYPGEEAIIDPDDRNILRRWPNAAAVTRSRSGMRAGASGSGRGVKWMTVDVTLGGGTKACGEMSNSSSTSQSHEVITDSRPYEESPVRAPRRWATSF